MTSMNNPPTDYFRSLQSLTDELAQQVLDEVAPEELLFYDDTARQYYANPQAALAPAGRDEALGFGLELAVITPVVISVAQYVVAWLADAAVDAAVKESSSALVSYLRGLIRRGKDSAGQTPAVAPLTPEQLRHVRTIAYQRALAVGVDARQAGVIAESTAGALVSVR